MLMRIIWFYFYNKQTPNFTAIWSFVGYKGSRVLCALFFSSLKLISILRMDNGKASQNPTLPKRSI